MSKDKATNLRQPVRSSVPDVTMVTCPSQSLPSSASAVVAKSSVLNDGISGSAMAVPPPKAATCAVRVEIAVKTTGIKKSPLVSKSDTSNCNMKQTKEVIDRSQELSAAVSREKELQQQVRNLQQLVDSLREDLNKEKKCNEDLLKHLNEMEDRHKATLEKETSARIKVEKDFEEKCKDLQTTLEDKKLTQQQLAELQLLTKKLEDEISDLKAQKDTEVAARDTKLSRLKLQMADFLTDNSRERQQQLEELRQNLEKVQEEADILRLQLRNVQKNAQDSCGSCKKMAVKMASMQTASEASERTIKNLKDVIALHDKKPTDWTQQQ